MPHCDSVLRVSIWAAASLLKVQAGYASGVSGHLYRFSRSRRVLLYKLIGGNDRRLSHFSHASLADWIPARSITWVRDETAETRSKSRGEPARVQVRHHRACEIERSLYDPGAKKEYRNEF
jgi:hypothetical protein